MIYAAPGTAGAKIAYKAKYENFINGQWTAPVKGQYFDVVTPVNGKASSNRYSKPCAEAPNSRSRLPLAAIDSGRRLENTQNTRNAVASSTMAPT